MTLIPKLLNEFPAMVRDIVDSDIVPISPGAVNPDSYKISTAKVADYVLNKIPPPTPINDLPHLPFPPQGEDNIMIAQVGDDASYRITKDEFIPPALLSEFELRACGALYDPIPLHGVPTLVIPAVLPTNKYNEYNELTGIFYPAASGRYVFDFTFTVQLNNYAPGNYILFRVISGSTTAETLWVFPSVSTWWLTSNMRLMVPLVTGTSTKMTLSSTATDCHLVNELPGNIQAQSFCMISRFTPE